VNLGGIVVPDSDPHPEFDHDLLEVSKREGEWDTNACELIHGFRPYDESHFLELPPRAQDFTPVVGIQKTRMQIVRFIEERSVSIDERFVAPGVRGPNLQWCAVLRHTAHLVEHEAVLCEVFKAVSREDRVDTAIGEWKRMPLDIDDAVDSRRSLLVQPDEAWSLGVTAPDVDLHDVGRP
jgi:hypothetical protein